VLLPSKDRKKSVLIVSPHFPPINAPDHQRVRMCLPYLGEFAWNATILTVQADCVEGTRDPLLERTVPKDTEIVRTGALPTRLTRKIGLGSLALRALPYLWGAGNKLLKRECFDLVYFSTTMFPVMILGPIWKKKFGLPYVVDFQDPWLDDYYERTKLCPPGGRLKHNFSRWIARWLEPKVMKDVSEVISVSPAYVVTLLERYPCLRREQFTVLPFGAPERDFEMLPSLGVIQTVFDRADGKQHWVYVGAAGPMMAVSLRLLFSALRTAREAEPKKWRDLQLHFVGTSYAPAGRGTKSAEPIAAEYGVADLVEERVERIPYFEALQTLTESDALLVIGSDSPGHSASKLYPYMLTQKPLLAIVHEQSPAVEILHGGGSTSIVTFQPGLLGERVASQMQIALARLRQQSTDHTPLPIDRGEFEQHTAREMTRRQCVVFDRINSNRP
jgi:glycosyl transferase family 4